MQEFDFLVIGSGSGLDVANAMARRGNSVAVVEEGRLGGTCLNRGCIPSKQLLYHADVLEMVERAGEFEIDAEVRDVDFTEIVQKVTDDVAGSSASIRRGLESSDVHDLFSGTGQFIDDRTVEIVDGDDEGATLRADTVLVATGTRPSIPPIDGVDEVDYLTSTEALRLETPPDHLVIVGGGYIAAELGHFFETFGSDVTIVGRREHLLPEADAEVGETVTDSYANRLDVYTGYEAVAVDEDGDEVTVEARPYSEADAVRAGDEVVGAPDEADDVTVTGDELLVAAGRRSNTDMSEERRQRRRTERFVEESEDVVTIVDPDGTVTYTSGSAKRVFGYDPDAIVGENLFDYLHPDGREHAMETFFSCVEESKSVTAECRLKSPDGGWFNIEGRCRNMLDDDAIGGILVYLRDVTEKKERARRFQGIFNQTFQFTGLLEPDGTVVEINDAALDFGGFEREEVIGNPFFEARWWTHSEAVYDEVRDAIDRAASGEFVRYETEVRGGNGLATIDFSVKPVTDEDGVSLLIVEGRDITAQQQRGRHLNVMQRVMRHNMRNDLGKIRGWTELMSEEPDATERAEQFGRVEPILDKWDSMTQKMKEITQVLRLEDGELAMTAASPLVEDVATGVREEYTDATVLTDGTDNESVQVPTTFREAVSELVENAVTVTETATVEVSVRSDDEWVEISVTDDGPGLPEMEADVLESGEEDPLNHGKGLGLWMVRMIVTQAGGEVFVDPSDNGTEVCLRLPTDRADETAPPGPTA